jgi:hypothetical protein
MTSRIFLTVVTALAVMAIAAPLAGARVASQSAADEAAYSSDAGAGVAAQSVTAYSSDAGAGAPVAGRVIEIDDPGATTTTVRTIDDGFDWGAAGIGAGAFLIAFVALGLITLRPNARHGLRIH